MAWRDHPAVLLLRFPSNGMQKAAMARLSSFLEDKDHRGTVRPRLLTTPSFNRVLDIQDEFQSGGSSTFKTSFNRVLNIQDEFQSGPQHSRRVSIRSSTFNTSFHGSMR